MFIDTHCHLQFRAYDDDRDDVIARCQELGMKLNLIGTQQKTSELAIALAEQYDWMYASIGLHPIQEYKVKVQEESTAFTARGEEFDEAFYNELAKHPKVVAVGETGMDRFHVPKDTSTEDVMAKQKDVFLAHYRVAQKNNLPLVIHVRDAHEDMIATLAALPEAQKGELRGTIHCFTGNWEQAQQYLSFGLHLGFTGVITYPEKKTNPEPQRWLNEVVENVPLDRVVIETDAPYLAPQSHRGKRSEPWMVRDVAEHFAKVRNMTREAFQNQVKENSFRLFPKMND